MVNGKVSGGKGVTWVSVALNGAEVSRQEERQAPKSEVTLNLPITLREGKNVLLVTAAYPEGNTAQAARVIFYDRPTPSPSPPRPETKPEWTRTVSHWRGWWPAARASAGWSLR